MSEHNPPSTEVAARALPHNIEAEQAVLGAILMNNEAFDQVSAIIDSRHFYDPVHRRIFERIAQRLSENRDVSPVLLKPYFENDEGLAPLGGVAYLFRLTEFAISVFNVKPYANDVYAMSVRRELMKLGDDIVAEAGDFMADTPPADQIARAEATLYQLAERGRYEGGFVDFNAALLQAVESANAAHKRGGGLAGVSSGLTDLDRKLGGLHPSDLLILAGRPSMGKTALATNIAFNVARAYKEGRTTDGRRVAESGGVVGFFSLEMSSEQLAARILSEQAEIPSEKIRRGEMDPEEFRRFVEASREIARAPLFIDDTPALPIATLAARARRLKRQHGLDLLVVDYLQLMRGSSKSGENRVQEVSEITQGLKAIAKELNIPVIALSQLSRQVESREDKRPQLSDLRESGSIEQDADVVMFVFREEYYVGRREPREGTPEYATWQAEMEAVHGTGEVIIGKQRHGPIGTVKLAFESRFTRFGDLAQEDRYSPDFG